MSAARRLPRRRPASLVVAALLAAAGLWCASSRAPSADAGWWDDLDKGEPVRLADLIAEPVRWRDKLVTFSCVFHAPDSIFSPYFTSFSADKHVNFTAWVDGSPLWEAEAFERDDFPYLYVRRDHPQWAELSRLPTFTRIELTGLVKDVYRQRPWIDVKGFRVHPSTLGRQVVEWVKTGDGNAAAGNVTAAEAHYRAALGEDTLDETYRLRIKKRLSDLLRSTGRPNDASSVDGGSPVVGGTPSPLPPVGALTDARPATSTPGTGAPPPAITNPSDLPGTPFDAPRSPNEKPRQPASPFRPATAPTTAPGAGTGTSSLPPPPVSGPSDLPGVPYDAPKPARPAPSAPPPTTGTASPETGLPPAPPPPSPAPGVPPPPPERTPRLSGVR